MKKSFKIRELDCAHCAQEIEDAASKGTEDDKFAAVLDEIKKLVKTIEPDAVLEA